MELNDCTGSASAGGGKRGSSPKQGGKKALQPLVCHADAGIRGGFMLFNCEGH